MKQCVCFFVYYCLLKNFFLMLSIDYTKSSEEVLLILRYFTLIL